MRRFRCRRKSGLRMKTKECTSCRRDLPLDEFYQGKSRRYGHCISCCSSDNRKDRLVRSGVMSAWRPHKGSMAKIYDIDLRRFRRWTLRNFGMNPKELPESSVPGLVNQFKEWIK